MITALLILAILLLVIAVGSLVAGIIGLCEGDNGVYPQICFASFFANIFIGGITLVVILT